MPYPLGAVTYRADIAGVVMETDMWENSLIHSRVCPSVTTEDASGTYPKFKLGAGQLLKREPNIRRAPGANSARGSLAYEWDNYDTLEYSFEIPVDRANRLKADKYFDALAVAARMAKRKIRLDREIRAAELTFNTTNYGSATNSGTAYTIANIATFDLGLDVDAIKAVLRGKGESDEGLSAVMSKAVFDRAKASTKLQNRLRGIGISSDTMLQVDEAAVAEALGLREVIVGKNYYDTTGENVTPSTTPIWGNTYIWIGRLGGGGSTSSMLTGGAQNTIVWSKFGGELGVFEYDEPQTKGTVTGCEEHVVEKVVNAAAGALLASQYS